MGGSHDGSGRIPTMPDYLSTWRHIANSDDPAGVLATHLAFLTDSDESRQQLDELLGNLVGAHIAGDELELVFQYAEYSDEQCVVSLHAPHTGDTSDAPASVTPVVRVHNGIGWESLGGGGFGFWGFTDGVFVGGGGWEPEALTEAEEANSAFLQQLADAGLTVHDVVSPSDYGQNWLIWNPAEQNLNGEPTVYFVSHGDCVAQPVVRAKDLAFGPLILSVMVQEILGKQILDVVYN
jgi:hypothetical protein